VEQFLAFMKGDLVLHRRKEEEVLFPILGGHIGVAGGPIAVMLSEHATEKALLEELDGALADARQGQEATERIRRAAEGILDLLRAHIQKEDHVLFPIAEDRLTPEEQAEGTRRMETIGTFWKGELPG
jgi:hemerythrin-like domain-containing protein